MSFHVLIGHLQTFCRENLFRLLFVSNCAIYLGYYLVLSRKKWLPETDNLDHSVSGKIYWDQTAKSMGEGVVEQRKDQKDKTRTASRVGDLS